MVKSEFEKLDRIASSYEQEIYRLQSINGELTGCLAESQSNLLTSETENRRLQKEIEQLTIQNLTLKAAIQEVEWACRTTPEVAIAYCLDVAGDALRE